MDVRSKFTLSPAKGTAADARKNKGALSRSLTRAPGQQSRRSRFALYVASWLVSFSDVNNKLHLEALRRREHAGASNFPNHVQPTKYNVQKTKNFVKRQRSKGQYHGGAEENSKVDSTFKLCSYIPFGFIIFIKFYTFVYIM